MSYLTYTFTHNKVINEAVFYFYKFNSTECIQKQLNNTITVMTHNGDMVDRAHNGPQLLG